MVEATEVQKTGLDGAIDRLCAEFAGVFARESVAHCVRDSHERLGPARIAMYQPLLAYRFARERLRASAAASGALTDGVPSVLFVCTHNSARSQLAAALLAAKAEGRITIGSAGTEPAREVDPLVLQVLAEIGIDATDAFPKPLTDEVVRGADVVVTMGCGDACPVIPGHRYLDWDLVDPAGTDLPTARAVRDRVDALVGSLFHELVPGGSNPERTTTT